MAREKQQQPRHTIVVGIDGSDQAERAIRYAVREAQARDMAIRLVHAVHDTVPMTPMMPLISVETLDEVARNIVGRALRLVHDLDPEVPVEAMVRPGTPTHAVVALADDAALIVLGHRDRSLLGRVLTSSTTTGVAARAHCPVVSVPSAWTDSNPHGRVVVGVDGSTAGKDALAVAFDAAQRRGATLTVLHAWKLPSGYDDIIVSRALEEQWRATATEQMVDVLAPWRALYPDVDVEIDLRHQFAAPALVGATEGADLCVVGRRGHGAPLGIYLGSVARTLIREARCPVEIAPQGRPEDIAPEPVAAEERVSPQS